MMVCVYFPQPLQNGIDIARKITSPSRSSSHLPRPDSNYSRGRGDMDTSTCMCMYAHINVRFNHCMCNCTVCDSEQDLTNLPPSFPPSLPPSLPPSSLSSPHLVPISECQSHHLWSSHCQPLWRWPQDKTATQSIGQCI